MEESEKRRERLRAIRSEAACGKDVIDSQSTLSNPLFNAKNTAAPLQSQENSRGSPRFDFYTDPLSSFSGDRKRSKPDIRTPNSSFASPLPCTTVVSRKWKSPEDTPLAPQQPQKQEVSGYGFRGSNWNVGFIHGGSPSTSSCRGGHFSASSPTPVSGSDMCSPSPNSGQIYGWRSEQNPSPNSGQIHGWRNEQNPSPNSGQIYGWRSEQNPSPNSGQIHGWRNEQNPSPSSGQIHGWRSEQNPSPSSWKNYGSDWRNAQNSSPNSGRGGPGWYNGSSPSPNSGRGCSGWYSGNSPSPNSGRGGSGLHGGNSQSPNSGRGYGRKGGRSRFFSVEQNPEKFFNTSMLEDPWKALVPVVWNAGCQSKSGSWLPQSISGEKVKSAETPPVFKSQANLAEFLSVSFNEVIGDDK